jgi:hypothetical protein
MKSRLFCLFLILILISAGCSKKHEAVKPTEQERITAILIDGTGKWTPTTPAGVTVDGLDVSADLFKDFSITFTSNKLFTTGTTPVWLREDTWRFKDDAAKVIIRNQDNKEITIVDISDTQLQLSLNWDQTTYEGGRSQSIPGKVVFTMNK